MCGNGLRCLVHFAHHLGAMGERGTVQSMAGIHSAEVLGPGRARVGITDPQGIRQGLMLEHRGVTYPAIFVNAGVPHIAIELESAELLEGLDVFTVGRALRHHPEVMPAGANINFYVRESPDRLRMRTYERGVEAETLACGTGAVSCFVSSHLLHDTRGAVTVITRSGVDLTIHLRREGDRFSDTLLEGPTSLVYTGELGPDFLP
jgi:diaminopimelate epimerase